MKKQIHNLYVFIQSKKKRKRKVKPFKNTNSSLFQYKTSGIHQSNYHVEFLRQRGYNCFVDAWLYPKTCYDDHNDEFLSSRIHKPA